MGSISPHLTFALDGTSSLPAGLSMNSAGVISGTPTAAAMNQSFRVTVTDDHPNIEVKERILWSIVMSAALGLGAIALLPQGKRKYIS